MTEKMSREKAEWSPEWLTIREFIHITPVNLFHKEQNRFMYFIHELHDDGGMGEDLLDQAIFLELMVFLNRAFAAVVNVHVHDLLIAVEMGERECVGAHAVFDGFFAGYTAIHRFSVLTIPGGSAAVF